MAVGLQGLHVEIAGPVDFYLQALPVLLHLTITSRDVAAGIGAVPLDMVSFFGEETFSHADKLTGAGFSVFVSKNNVAGA